MARRFFLRVLSREIGTEIAETLKERCSSLSLKIAQFGGVAQYAATESWDRILPAILVWPDRVRRVPEAFGGGPNTMTDLFRIALLQPVDRVERAEEQASTSADVVAVALASNTALSDRDFANRMWSDERVQIQASEPSFGPGDWIEWNPPEQAAIDETGRTVRATVFNWQVVWTARA